MKLILAQDDCAPDSLEYFEDKFEAAVGVDLYRFKKTSVFTDTGTCLKWERGGCILEFCRDDPYYKLFKEAENGQ